MLACGTVRVCGVVAEAGLGQLPGERWREGRVVREACGCSDTKWPARLGGGRLGVEERWEPAAVVAPGQWGKGRPAARSGERAVI